MTWPTIPGQPAVGSAAQASWADAVIQALAVFANPSTAYTPAWTSSGTAPSLGNGTLTGTYWQFGKLVIGRANLTIGSTTSGGTGAWYFSLPVATYAAVGAQDPLGLCFVRQASRVGGLTVVQSTTTLLCVLTSNSSGVGATSPGAWSAGQNLTMSFQYESA